MQIQVIEEKTGLDRATIRYYEQEGLIKPKRLPNGYRDYSESQLQELMKIKLFRQIGLSLETISQLINGTNQLQGVLESQLIILKDHKAQIDNAEIICKMIMQDDVTYETIKPDKYVVIGKSKCIEEKYSEVPYIEYVYLESHPVRRFLGRYLDRLLTSAILMLIVVVILRIRPLGDTQNTFLSIASTLLVLPLNALFLRLFGTTPGKFVVGIYLKTPEGKNMSFIYALRREWAVFRHGLGYNIPILNLIRLYNAYQIHTAGRELEWDYDYNADVLYTPWSTERGILSTIFCVICAVIIGFSSVNSQMPIHRTENLTLAQFAENYNIYAQQRGMSSISGRLTDQGIWYTPGRTPKLDKDTVVIFEDSEENRLIEDIDWDFVTDENNILNEISVKIRSNTVISIDSALSGKVSLAIYTAIMSQPKGRLITADEATQIMSEFMFITDKKDKYYYFDDIIVHIMIQNLPEGIYGADVSISIP